MKKFIILIILMMFAIPAFGAAPTTVKDFMNTIAEGNLGGYYSWCPRATFDASATEKVASNNPTEEYPFPETAAVFEVSSSSALDVGSIEVQYLDSNWDLQTVTIDMTGQTSATSEVTAIRFIQARLVYDPTYTSNQGDIYVFANTGVTAGVPDDLDEVFMKINAGQCISRMAVFSVPRNYIGIVNDMFLNAAVDSLSETVSGTAHVNYLVNGVRLEYVPDSVTVGIFPDVSFSGSFRLPEKSDFWITGVSSDASSIMRMGFCVYIRPE